MKHIFIFAFLVAGISANVLKSEVESLESERVVDYVSYIVGNITQNIKDADLDPLEINREARQFALSVPEIFTATAVIENVLFSGLSDIRILDVDYENHTRRHHYVVELPHIQASTSYSSFEVSGFGEKLEIYIEGRLDIDGVRIAGFVVVEPTAEGPVLRKLSADLILQGIRSSITTLDVFGYDLAEQANTLFDTTIPYWIEVWRRDLNILLMINLWDVVSRALNPEASN